MYRVLIADDEKTERKGIRTLLVRTGIKWEIAEATNGRDALELMEQNTFDILLTDIKMPFLDGLELIEKAVKLNASIKCVIFSGYGEFEYARKALVFHVVDYLLKPVDPDVFEQLVVGLVQQIDTENFSKNIVKCNAGSDQRPCRREVEEVKQYIYHHYNEEISVDMLAQSVCMSVSYLSHIFKDETGQNITTFIKSCRMEKAKEMLENTWLKIAAVSNAVGYPNVSYFCRSFRSYYGVSPSKYRSGEVGYEEDCLQNE